MVREEAARPQHLEWFDECYNPGPRLVDDIQQGDLCKYVSPYKEDPRDGEMMTIIDVCTAADLYSAEFDRELAHRRRRRLPRNHKEISIDLQTQGCCFRKESMLAHCLTSTGMKWIPCKQLKIV